MDTVKRIYFKTFEIINVKNIKYLLTETNQISKIYININHKIFQKEFDKESLNEVI